MASPVSAILDGIASARKAFENDEAGSREALIDYSRSLITALEIPSEFVQRTFWAEVCYIPRLYRNNRYPPTLLLHCITNEVNPDSSLPNLLLFVLLPTSTCSSI